jgi:hypothetical protein
MLSLVSTLSKLTEQCQVNAVAQTLYTYGIADTIEIDLFSREWYINYCIPIEKRYIRLYDIPM